MVELNHVDELVTGHEFPARQAELVEAYGERRIELQGGSETFADVIRRDEQDVYESSQDVRDSVVCFVGHEAVGRRYYSDRDAPALGETRSTPVSF